MRKKLTNSEETSEIKAELLSLTGSTASYNALLDNIGEQLRAIAKDGHRIIMHGNKVVRVQIPEKKKRISHARKKSL